MNRVSLMLVLSLVFLFCSHNIIAADVDLGEKLVRQLWADMKTKNWAEIEKQVASGFQSVHEDGARDRDEEIELIKNLNLGEYTLTNFKTTQNGPVVIVTYSVTVEETIAGRRLSKRSSMRLSSWLKTEDGWKWIIHANLNPLK